MRISPPVLTRCVKGPLKSHNNSVQLHFYIHCNRSTRAPPPPTATVHHGPSPVITQGTSPINLPPLRLPLLIGFLNKPQHWFLLFLTNYWNLSNSLLSLGISVFGASRNAGNTEDLASDHHLENWHSLFPKDYNYCISLSFDAEYNVTGAFFSTLSLSLHKQHKCKQRGKRME